MRIFTTTIPMILLIISLSSVAYSQHIMCVDRDGSFYSTSFTDVWPKFQGALDANGYTYTYFEVTDPELNGPDATAMAEHDAVIWFTGETWQNSQTMTIDDEFNLLLYLTVSSGKLFLSAQDYLWDRYPNAGALSSGDFPYDVLGLREVSQDLWNLATPDTLPVYGVEGSLAEGMVFGIQDVYSTAKEGLWIDLVMEHAGMDLINIRVPGSDSIAAYQFEGANYKSIFSTVSFGGIIDTNVRTDFMNRIVSWLMGTTGTIEMESSGNLEILLYPNPARELLKIGMLDTMDEVRIFNSTGQMVCYERPDDTRIDVNIRALKQGMYFVTARTAKGIVTAKFLKE